VQATCKQFPDFLNSPARSPARISEGLGGRQSRLGRNWREGDLPDWVDDRSPAALQPLIDQRLHLTESPALEWENHIEHIRQQPFHQRS
jgi:hypothetical protein